MTSFLARPKRVLAAAALLAFTSGCDEEGGGSVGDGSDDPEDDVHTCETFEACGGDPSGSWTIVETCTKNPTRTDERCEGYSHEVTNITQTGIVELGTAGSWVGQDVSTTSVDYHMPVSCLGSSDQGSCDLYGSALLTNVEVAGGVGEVACTAGSETCECQLEQTLTRDVEGTWATSGETITFAHGSSAGILAGLESQFEYCVAGNRLAIQVPDDTTGVTSTQILERR